tara:strand:+ start:254 stop:532 length:279 start_codon:yes stop_codon:yes gene_type:complete
MYLGTVDFLIHALLFFTLGTVFGYWWKSFRGSVKADPPEVHIESDAEFGARVSHINEVNDDDIYDFSLKAEPDHFSRKLMRHIRNVEEQLGI